MMWNYKLLFWVILAALVMHFGCSNDNGTEKDTDGGTDGGQIEDTDEDTNEDTGEDTDVETDVGVNWNVPSTEQNECYNNYVSIPCPGTAGSSSCATTNLCGQDAQYPNIPRTFTITTVKEKNIVEDSVTGLIWTQEFAKEKKWEEAIDYCNNLDYSGHIDWRLPSPMELATLTQYHGEIPAIDISAFPETGSISPDDLFWTSMTYGDYTFFAWGMFFSNGTMRSFVKGNILRARCVRGRPLKIGSFEPLVISSDLIVKDLGTDLMWQGCSADQSGSACDGTATRLDWKNALSYCEGLTWGGFDDWRLPNVRELNTIIDYEKDSPSIDSATFPNTSSDLLWSSTSHGNPSHAMIIDLEFGAIGSYYKNPDNTEGSARCVRN